MICSAFNFRFIILLGNILLCCGLSGGCRVFNVNSSKINDGALGDALGNALKDGQSDGQSNVNPDSQISVKLDGFAPIACQTDAECDDHLDCTDDKCADKKCAHSPKVGTCYIDAACFNNGDYAPQNNCSRCDTSYSSTAWKAVDEGAACADDGLNCTSDICQSGKCVHPVYSGYCAVNGHCFADKTIATLDGCGLCDTSLSTTAASPLNGAACDDQDPNTVMDFCMGLTCKGFTATLLNSPAEFTGAGYSPGASSFWATGNSALQISGGSSTAALNGKARIINHDFIAADDGVFYFWNTTNKSWSPGSCGGAAGTPTGLWGTTYSNEKVAYIIYGSKVYKIVTTGGGSSASCTLAKDFQHSTTCCIGCSLSGGYCHCSSNENTIVLPIAKGIAGTITLSNALKIWTHSIESVPVNYTCTGSSTSCTWNKSGGGTSSIFRYYDGGQNTWTDANAYPTDLSFNSMTLFVDSEIWAAGNGGLIYKYNGTSWVGVSSSATLNVDLTSIYPTGQLVYVVGARTVDSERQLVLSIYNKRYLQWFGPHIGYKIAQSNTAASYLKFNAVTGQGNNLYIVGGTADPVLFEARGLVLSK